MKKQMNILLTLMLLSLSSIGLNFTIVNSSFTQTDSVCPGSLQYVDVTQTDIYTTSDRVKVYITHSGNNIQLLLDSSYYGYYTNLPTNGDGSKRVYFYLPQTYLPGGFEISVDLTPSLAKGLMCTPQTNGINKYQVARQILYSYDLDVGDRVKFLVVFYSDGSKGKFLKYSE